MCVCTAKATKLVRLDTGLVGLRIASHGTKDLDVGTFYKDGRLSMGFRDNARGEVALLWEMMRQMISSESEKGTTRQGRPLPSSAVKRGRGETFGSAPLAEFQSPMFERHLGQKASARRKHEDLLFSALFHWRCNLASRAFKAWRWLHLTRRLGEPSAPDRPHATQVGLRNLGNTCYVNAVLQALASVPTFRADFAPQLVSDVCVGDSPPATPMVGRRSRAASNLDHLASTADTNGLSLGKEFRRFISVVTAKKLIRFTPDGIVRLVWRLFGSFRGFMQHDSAEILVHMLDRLEKEDKACVAAFSGRLVQQITFKVGSKEAVSSTHMPFTGPWTIEVPLRFRVVGRQKKGAELATCSLEECLAEAVAAERLEGPNQYELEGGRRVDASKRVLLDVAPRVLVLHINRTSWDFNGVSKIQTHVRCPFELSLDPYQVDGGPALRYELQSIVAHHGHSMTGGHFTAYGRRLGDPDTWLHFNDARVTKVQPKEVSAAQPYVLFYELT